MASSQERGKEVRLALRSRLRDREVLLRLGLRWAEVGVAVCEPGRGH